MAGIIPKDNVRENDSMAFQKLTKVFLVRKFAVMLGLIGNVPGNSLYVRLAHSDDDEHELPTRNLN